MNSDLILIAMSGGVDSSVATAILAQQGYKLAGITMSVWDGPGGADGKSKSSCCSIDDADDARRVAQKLGVPHYTMNVKSLFREKVIDYFTGEYMTGRTPNPCVLCNQVLKFDYLFEQGRKFGAVKVATGHYARIGTFNGRKLILRGVDRSKDQSYFLFSIPNSRLNNIIFPLGRFSKLETRALAIKHGLNVAQKPESQEVCFIPDNDYNEFIRTQTGGKDIGEGDIVDHNGAIIGHHKGYPFYTIGQRRGLGISAPEPKYVTRIEPEPNRIVVGNKSELYSKALLATSMTWHLPPEEIQKMDITARIRYRSEDSPAMVTPVGDDGATVEFEQPQLAITPGQAVVFYHGEYVLGGGWIEKRLD